MRTSKQKTIERLLVLLLMMGMVSGCNGQVDANQSGKGNGPESSEFLEDYQGKEQRIVLPTEYLTTDSMYQILLDMIKEKRETETVSFLLESNADSEVQQIIQSVQMADSVYLQYYIADIKSDYIVHNEQEQYYVDIVLEVDYFDETVCYDELIYVTTYEEAYEAIDREFQTGFEKIVLVFPEEISMTNVAWLPEELMWNNAINLPYGFKKVVHFDFQDTQGMQLTELNLEYDCYGLTKEDQITAQKEVKKCVEDLANEVKDLTADVAPDEKIYRQCKVLYDLVQQRISFDYRLNDALLDLEGNNDAYIATQRSIWGALVNGESVCSGYATAFHEVCKALGIKSWVLSGYADNGDHAWNMAIMDNGCIAYFDPTWGDSRKWHDTYCFMTEETMRSENRRVYDFLYIPDEFYDAGYVDYIAPPCLYD